MSIRRPVETLTNAAKIAIAVVLLGCAGRPLVFKGGGDAATDAEASQSDQGNGAADARPTDTSDEAAPKGLCTQDEDCVAVLDHRSGFECWAPSAASRDDLRRDPCLVPWRPDPMCTTAAPPKDCPGGLIAVDHSCFTFGSCVAPRCSDGRCWISVGLSGTCGQSDAGSKSEECDTLRDVYANALRAARQCYPAGDRCSGELPDICGCMVPYNPASRCADRAVAAYAAWRNAGCQHVACGGNCVVVGLSSGVCVPNPTGVYGTCFWQ